MSTPSFDPQPCCDDGGGSSVPVPLDVNVVGPDPIDVNVTNQLSEPVDVNVISPSPLPVSGTVNVTPNPLPVTGTVGVAGTVPVSVSGPNPLPVSGTVGVSGTVPVTGTVAISGTIPVTATVGGSATASTTLNAATTGTGTTVDFASARLNVTLVILVAGTVTSGVVDLQASHDGTNWVKVASSASLSTGVNQFLNSANTAFRWFRGVVSENLAGGGSVTATLMYS